MRTLFIVREFIVKMLRYEIRYAIIRQRPIRQFLSERFIFFRYYMLVCRRLSFNLQPLVDHRSNVMLLRSGDLKKLRS